LLHTDRQPDHVRKHPIATKRAMRAMLKAAADLRASQPERAARRLVDRGFAPRYDYALQTLSDVPYDRWANTIPRTPSVTTRCASMNSALSIDAAEDHRREHRLGLLQRIEARAEGVIHAPGYWCCIADLDLLRSLDFRTTPEVRFRPN
jgi:hypothetical protein